MATVAHRKKRYPADLEFFGVREIREIAEASLAHAALSLFERGGLGGPPETRTPDPLIKSQLLYQLS
jgi:hypothetical protein